MIGSYDILRLGKSTTDPRIAVFHVLLMNGKYIANLHDPDSLLDVATKNYVGNVTKQKCSGYIPVLEDDFSLLGFMAISNVSSPG